MNPWQSTVTHRFHRTQYKRLKKIIKKQNRAGGDASGDDDASDGAAEPAAADEDDAEAETPVSRSSSPAADTHHAAEPVFVPNPPPLVMPPIFSIVRLAMTGLPMPVANPASRSGGDDDGDGDESDEFFEGDGGDYWW